MTTTTAFNQRINSRLEQLTKSERRIADYLQRNFEEAAFFSAAELAERLDLSEATVVRFAQSIGFSGFPELRQCLQELFKEKVTHAALLRKKLAELSPETHVLEQVIAMEMEYLTDALRTVSREAFDEAVRLVYGARRLFVYGLSGSATLAELLEHRLRRFGIEVVPLTQSGREVCEKLLMPTDEDAFLAILFFNLSEVMVSTLEYAKHCGCQVILLTDTLGPHLRDKVDVLLEARRGPVMAFHSLIVPMAIIQALIIAVAMADQEKALATLDRLDDIRERLNFVATVKI
jgi:DNA-binding MurR/RpiR family transcriptional regulator